MFRQKALVKLQSPEHLDEPLQIINRMNRLAIATIVGLAVVALIWASYGYIPETGRGQGILITPSSVLTIPCPASGQILEWYVQEGDIVQVGQIIGRLKQDALEQTLEQTIFRKQQTITKNKIVGNLKRKFSNSERQLLKKKEEILTNQIAYLEDYIQKKEELMKHLHQKDLQYLAMQKNDLEKEKSSNDDIVQGKKEQLESYSRLRKDDLVVEDSWQNIKQSYEDAQLHIKDLILQIQDLDLQKIQSQEMYLQNENSLSLIKNKLANTKLQLQELNNKKANLDKTDRETKFQEENEVNELERNIKQTQEQLKLDSEIKSIYSGRILELSFASGQMVNSGQSIATIDIAPDNSKLVALAYFQDDIGKQLKRGMQVLVSPSTVSQKQYGCIRGEIISVSNYPVTQEAAVNHIGNSNVASNLMGEDYRIEVFIQLYKDSESASGYHWTSQHGPDTVITSGTTATIWAIVERRYPISFVLPKIKEWLGL